MTLEGTRTITRTGWRVKKLTVHLCVCVDSNQLHAIGAVAKETVFQFVH